MVPALPFRGEATDPTSPDARHLFWLNVLPATNVPRWRRAGRAYRAAARTAHPDAPGGSEAAFLAVAGAFERPSGKVAGGRRKAG